MKVQLLDPWVLLVDRRGEAVYPVWGGDGTGDDDPEDDGESDDDDLDDDDDDGDDDDETDDADDKKKPPAKKAVKKAAPKKEDDDSDDKPAVVTKEKYDAQRLVLRKQRDINRANTTKLNALQKQIDDAANDKDGQAAKRALREEVENDYKPVVIAAVAKAAFVEAGAKRTGVDKLIRLLDNNALTVDAKGGVDGLEDQIEDLQEDFPELFSLKKEEEETTDDKDSPRRPARRAGRVDTGNGSNGAINGKPRKLNMTQQLMKANRDALRFGRGNE